MRQPGRALGHVACRLVALVAFVGASAAQAQPYPNRPITLVSPVPTGAAVDLITRAWVQCASGESLANQPIVLVNRPGGNGVVAANAMRQAAADGYTLMVAGMSQTAITPFTFRTPPYLPEKEFEGATIFAASHFVLVAGTQAGVRSVREMQEAGRTGTALAVGVPAVATPAHLLGAALLDRLGLSAPLVPMGSESQGITQLLGGQIPLMVLLAGSAAPHIAGGKLVPLLAFSEQRLPQLPQVPTVVELTADASLARTAWLGITTKAGSPPQVAEAVHRWTRACLETPQFRQILQEAQVTPVHVGPADYAGVVRRDMALWRPWLERLGIRND